MTTTTKLASLFALGRLAFGVGLIATPERVARGWIGDEAARPATRVIIRGLGARDVALSAGALVSAGDREVLRRWIAVAIGCDVTDVIATLAAPDDALPANARWGTVALGGGSALAGLLLFAALDG